MAYEDKKGPTSGRKDKKKKNPCKTGAKKEMLTGKALQIAKDNGKPLFKCVPNVPKDEPYKEEEREEPGNTKNKYNDPNSGKKEKM